MERTTIFFEGSVTTRELEMLCLKMSIENSEGTDIIVGGSLIEGSSQRDRESLEIPGSLLIAESSDIFRTYLKVHGDLYCLGNFRARGLTIKDDCLFKGLMQVTVKAEIGGDCVMEGGCYADLGTIKVFGDFTCLGDCLETYVHVGGFFVCNGRLVGEVRKL